MRFKASVRNINTFIKLTSSLNSLGKLAWVRLDDDQVRFTVIPEQGTQVWAVLPVDAIFEEYTIQSATENNAINLEVPLVPLVRALRSAQVGHRVSLRMTKKENVPLLSLTIVTSAPISTTVRQVAGPTQDGNQSDLPRFRPGPPPTDPFATQAGEDDSADQPRDMTITQDIPIRVLSSKSVSGIHEPLCPEPQVHIQFPSLLHLKLISERFTKLALSPTESTYGSTSTQQKPTNVLPKLEVSATMHGDLKLSIRTPNLNLSSHWRGLHNPELDPEVVEGGEEGMAAHPSTRMRDIWGEEGWATVRVEGRDWGRVLGVGRLGGRVIACFCHEHALILYVYIGSDDPDGAESVLTVMSFSARILLILRNAHLNAQYYISSYSA
ncbi:MAG: hypothetical protein MMC33_003510 [Icmadophila ericetorum]|nr:hypothetical protein [Icmadophila ericetorum]